MHRSVLICGASFAGLSTAYWMATFGYRVTVVELAATVKQGGTPVNIQGRTIAIARRMGLLDRIRQHALNMQGVEFRNAADVVERSSMRQPPVGDDARDEYEIERDVLLGMLFDAVKDKVEFMFGDSIESLNDEAHQVAVSFRRGARRAFDLVFGCDGVHSTVRRLCFGDESQYLRYLGAYFSITIVQRSLIPDNTTQMYNEPGVAVMLNAYNGKTDICLCFQSAAEIPYDYRNAQDQRRIMAQRFADVGWRTPEWLAEVRRCDNFYFDKLCHTSMPCWSKGRIALVGDAAYCPSPAAGRGGSLAIDGAAALADAFIACDGDIERAFEHYQRSFRPFVDRIQADVIEIGLDFFLPRTAEAIRERNSGCGPMP